MSFILNWGFKYISQRVFRENKWNKFGTEDPYYETYEIEQQSFFGGPSKKKKLVKKPRSTPVGLSENDEGVLKRVMRRAYHLDMLFNVFGYRIGWSGIVGVLPIVGDVTGVVFSLLLFKTAREVDGGLPWDLQLYILLNIVVDFLLGLVPIVGDLVEVMYKANSRNALLLEKHLEEKAKLNVARSSIALGDSPAASTNSSVTNSAKFNLDSDGSSEQSFEEAARKQHQLNQDLLERKMRSTRTNNSNGLSKNIQSKNSPLNL